MPEVKATSTTERQHRDSHAVTVCDVNHKRREQTRQYKIKTDVHHHNDKADKFKTSLNAMKWVYVYMRERERERERDQTERVCVCVFAGNTESIITVL